MHNKYKIAALSIGVICLAVNLCKIVANHVSTSRFGEIRPSLSPDEAKRKGVFLCAYITTPSTIQWNEKQRVSVKDAWLECEAVRDYSLIWFPCWKKTGRFWVCMTFSEGESLLTSNDGPILAIRDSASMSTTSDGRSIVVYELFGSKEEVVSVAILHSWSKASGLVFTLRKGPID